MLMMTPKKRNLLLTGLLFGLAVCLAVGCGMQKETLLSGRTMGTFYHIKIISGRFEDLSGLREKIEARLEQISQSMSTYRPESEISRFNRMPATETMAVSADFFNVLRIAQKVHALSGGAWDGTIKPLVNLWGFGNARPVTKAPAAAKIKAHLQNLGFHHIRLLASRRVGKQVPGITLDLASIAKGYGVEAVAGVVRRAGYRDFLAEIGGEVVASGVREDGRSWVVGINRPVPDATANAVYRAVSLTDGAMATSGDYRNFFELEGVRYSHVIDPRNGYPVSNRVVSVSVVAPNCTLADGLATALMVMGPGTGIALVNRLQTVECLMIVQAPDGPFVDYASSGFSK